MVSRCQLSTVLCRGGLKTQPVEVAGWRSKTGSERNAADTETQGYFNTKYDLFLTITKQVKCFILPNPNQVVSFCLIVAKPQLFDNANITTKFIQNVCLSM